MKKKALIINVLWLTMAVTQTLYADNHNNKNELTIYQVMQRVIDRYPSLKISALELEQAASQRQQVESQLGWILNNTGEISRDLSALGTPSDRFDINGQISRQLESGSSISLNGGYRYEDSSLTFSPILPNPAHTTRLDLSYRMPLLKGKGNPLYSEGLISADAGKELASANALLTRITLAEKVSNLFYAAVQTEARLDNAIKSVQRTRKLENYINKNVDLGLSESKDTLQVRAQLYSKLADLSAIKLQDKQQQSSLNRLMLEDWRYITKTILTQHADKNYNIPELIETARLYHPLVKISQAKLNIAESKIDSALDNKNDSLDFVFSVGTRTSNGQSTTATVSEQDWAGAVKLEYQHLFDDRGISSKYKQALIEKNIAQQNLQTSIDDIRYTVSGLVSEIKAATAAVKTAKQKLTGETLKLKEAEQRYRNGRANTAQLIQFQNEYSFAELSYQNQKVDLNKRIIALQIFTGQFWKELDAKHGDKR